MKAKGYGMLANLALAALKAGAVILDEDRRAEINLWEKSLPTHGDPAFENRRLPRAVLHSTSIEELLSVSQGAFATHLD